MEISDSENENQQEIIPVEIDSDISKDQKDNIKLELRALPHSSNVSELMKETLTNSLCE